MQRGTDCVLVYVFYLFAYIMMSIEATPGPQFDVDMLNLTVGTGQQAWLPCKVTDSDGYEISWKYKGITLSTDETVKLQPERYAITKTKKGEWNLIINNIAHADRGNYFCTINTVPVRNKTINLHVTVPPEIPSTSFNRDLDVKEGDSMFFLCNATGDPKPEVTWYRLNSTKEPKKITNIYGIGEMIIFENVTQDCEGIYQCVAKSKNIGTTADRIMSLNVQYGPIITRLNDRIGQSPGKETMLACDITANPQYESYWTRPHGTEKLTNTTRHKITTVPQGGHKVRLFLSIRPIEQTDYGFYQCHSANHLGRTSKYVQLINRPASVTSYPIVSVKPTDGWLSGKGRTTTRHPPTVSTFTTPPVPQGSSQQAGGDQTHKGQGSPIVHHATSRGSISRCSKRTLCMLVSLIYFILMRSWQR